MFVSVPLQSTQGVDMREPMKAFPVIHSKKTQLIMHLVQQSDIVLSVERKKTREWGKTEEGLRYGVGTPGERNWKVETGGRSKKKEDVVV